MSDERQKLEIQEAGEPTSSPTLQAAAEAPSESLDSIEDIDFLLEEIENKIAPLALA